MKKTKLALLVALGLVSLGLASPALAKSNSQPFNNNYGKDVYKIGYEDALLKENYKGSDSSKKSSDSKTYGPEEPEDIKKKNEAKKNGA